MSAIFLLPVCLTYWPRKYTTCVDSHSDNSNKFEVDMTTHCWVIAFFADTLHDLVTLTFDLLTLNSCHTWQVTWPTLPPSLKTLRLELWFITFPIGYHWKCVCGHCTCTKSHDPWARGQKQLHFWNPRHRIVNPLQLRWLYDEGSSSYLQNNAQFSVKKAVSVSAHVENHVICERCPECLIAVVLNDVDLLYQTSKVEHLIAFAAIFSTFLTVRVQKWLFANFQCKFRHYLTFPQPWFPDSMQNFGDLVTFSIDLLCFMC